MKLITDEMLIQELKEIRNDTPAVNHACLERLKDHVRHYGKEGKIAVALLDIVGEILEL